MDRFALQPPPPPDDGMHGLAIGPPLFWPKNQGRFAGPYCLSRPKVLTPYPVMFPNTSVQVLALPLFSSE